MTGGAICGAVILVGLGLLSIFARDMLWEMTQWSNSLKGLASERSENWDTWSVISGVILIIIGAGLVIAVLSSSAQEQRELENATATSVSRLAAMEATYAPIVATLRPSAELAMQEVSGRQFGLPASMRLNYGLCSDEGFYLYARTSSRFGRSDAYVQGTSPEYCEPEGWSIYDSVTVGRSADEGNWYTTQIMIMPTFEVSTYLAPLATATPALTRPAPTPAATQKGQAGP